MKELTTHEERAKYAPDARWYKYPLCVIQGHDRRTNDKGWHEIYCRTCGQSLHHMTIKGLYRRFMYRVSRGFLWLANWAYGNDGPTISPHYRGVDSKTLMNLGTEHSCDAYSYEHIKSLIEQDGPDGFGATAPLSWLISEEGWQRVGLEDIDMINESLEQEANKQEREKTMKIMRGELPHE